MRIAFASTPGVRGRWVEAEDCCWGRVRRIVPAMLLACASEAQRAGHEVCYLDMSLEKAEVLHAWEPDVVVHPLAWQYHRAMHEKMVAMCGDLPRIVLAVPPGYARHYAELIPPAVAVLFSEPEIVFRVYTDTLAEFLEAVLPHTRQPNCLHALGPIDYSLLPERYWAHSKATVVQVTRGCPYRCTFCVWGGSTVTDTTFRMRPARLVAEELRQIRNLSRQATGEELPLYLLCAQLTSDLDWIDEFHAQMVDDPYPYQSNVGLSELTDENLVLLRETGLSSTSVGLEALTDRTLALLGKPHTIQDVLDGFLLLFKHGPRFRVHFRYGYGETGEDVREAVGNLRRLHKVIPGGLRVGIAPIIHYEGTVIRDVDYELKPHPDYVEECLIMAHPPSWRKFCRALREYGWLKRVGLAK